MEYEAAEIMVPTGDRVVVVDDGGGRMWRFTDSPELGIGSVEYAATSQTAPPPTAAVEAAKRCLADGGGGGDAGQPLSRWHQKDMDIVHLHGGGWRIEIKLGQTVPPGAAETDTACEAFGNFFRRWLSGETGGLLPASIPTDALCDK